MAEVGVLNLQVRAESSEQATQSLRQLAGALQRVRNAVNGGLKLAAVGTSVKRFTDKINESVSNETIAKINRLGEALQKLNSVGNLSNVTINIKEGKIASVRDKVKDTADETKNLKTQIDTLRNILSDGLLFGDLDENETAAIKGRIAELEENIGTALPGVQSAADTAKDVAEVLENVGEQIAEIENPIKDTEEKVEEFANSFDQIGDKSDEAISRLTTGLDEASERLKAITNDVYSYVNGDFYGVRPDNKNVHVKPTDLSSRTPQAMSLLGEWGENLQAAAIKDEMRGTGETFEEVTARIEEYINRMREATPAVEEFAGAVEEMNSIMQNTNWSYNGPDTFRDLFSMWNQYRMMHSLGGGGENIAGYLPEGYVQAEGTVTDFYEETESTNAFRDALSRLGIVAEEARSILSRMSSDAPQLVSALKRIVSPVTSLVKQFTRMARMRMIRYAIREIAKGFREGVENVYWYSNAINGSFVESMDSAASALLTMKNSIGAAVAPVIEMLIPYLKIVVNWFITLINYVNQFFALLNGQSTWTHAVDATTAAYEDQTSAAQSASAAVKDLLADWDELNIIQSDTSSGGGLDSSNVGEDYLNMFEQVATFENRIKDIVDFIKDNFDKIKKIALEIAAALLTWKVSSMLTGILSDLFGIAAAGLTAKVVFDVVTMFDEEYLKTGDAGYLVKNLLTTLVGAVLMRTILSKVLGGELAELAIPITLAVSATADIKTLLGDVDTSALDKKSLALATVAALKTGGALGYLFWLSGGSIWEAAAFGGAGAIATFGAIVGLKTIVRAVDSGITEETIKSTALSSLSIGLGAGIFSKLAGATALAAFGTGALAAGLTVATIAAAIGIGALLTVDKKEIAWGSETLSEEQIQEFVNEKMFTIDVKATIENIETTVDDGQKLREEIRQGLAKSGVPLNLIVLGLATDETYAKLQDELLGENGVIEKLKSYAKQQQNLIELSYTLMPVTGEDGKIDKKATADAIMSGSSGWTEVEKYMGQIGTRLAEALKGSTKDGLTTYDDELIAELTEKLNNVQKAVTGAQFASAATGNLLNGLEAKSATGVIEQFNAYKDELKEAYQQILSEELASYNSLEAFYLARGEEGDAEKAKYYADKAAELTEMWTRRIEESVENATEPGKKIIRESLKKLLEINPEDIVTDFGGNAKDPIVSTLLNSLGVSIRNADGQYTNEVKEQMQSLLDSILSSVLTDEDYSAVKAAIDSGAVTYADFFTSDTIDKIIGMVGNESYYGDAIRKAVESIGLPALLNEAVKESLESGSEGNLTETVSEGITQAAENANVDIPDVEYDVDVVEDDSLNTPVQAPGIDNSEFNRTLNERVEAARMAAQRIQEYLSMFAGAAPYTGTMSGWNETSRPAAAYASGGFPKSYDLVMANENGNFEMMGRMGHQPVVANNQQIVDGISKGVSSANGTMVGEMRNMVTLMQLMLNKEFVAKAVPSSAWGRNNSKSADAYSKVTG